MGRIGITTAKLLEDCEQVLGPKGRLSTAIPGFKSRQTQLALATEIAKAILEKKVLVAEAGTGTGKTYAYLVPALLSRKKTIISTATKTLQDQLFLKDLPLLIAALGIGVNIQILKGRSSYLCRHRIKLYAEESQISLLQHLHDLTFVREKLKLLKLGERSELPEISEESGVWPYITSTVDNCLGADCAEYKDCFLVNARQRALKADLLVINHHLFFADLRIKDEGFGELLPDVEIIIFDEGHQLPDIAAASQAYRWGTRQLRDLMDDFLREWPVLDLAAQPLNELSIELDRLLQELPKNFPEKEDKLAWELLIKKNNLKENCKAIEDLLTKLKNCSDHSEHKDSAGLKSCARRVQDLKRILNLFLEDKFSYIRWLERFKNSLVFHATPYDISKDFQELLTNLSSTIIFTSATLTLASSFECFTKPLGLNDAKTALFPSPFNYKEQALLYLPRSLPDPKNPEYYTQLLKRVLPLISALGGRSFFLFTSHQALKQVAKILSDTLNYPLLIQGTEAKPILLARFRALGNAVLLGTASFWEGVDVKGEALSCVIIDKLPFSNPSDPVISGKMSYLKKQGYSPFDSLSLPAAVLALKQGIGRLIRDEKDRGVLVIADPRLTARDYGAQIFASLPSLTKTRDEVKVLEFIESLSKNETVSP